MNGVYTDDPIKNPDARRYETLTFEEALAGKLGVMDSTAFSMCRDNDLPVLVFNFFESGSLEKALTGDLDVATIVTSS